MAQLSIEMAFALADSQELISMSVDEGSTVADVIAASGFSEAYSQIDFSELAIGIWGVVVARDQIVKDGDRVEIYRPLQLNPRDARRKLARAGRTMSGKGAD